MRHVSGQISPLASILLCSAMALACNSKADPGTADTTTTAVMTGTSAPNPTAGGITEATSSSSTTEPTPTTDSPTCPSFLCKKDDLPTDRPCDVFAQDCPEGKKCVPVKTGNHGDWNDARCVPVTGNDVEGEPCTSQSVADGLDSCAKGFVCFFVDMLVDGHGTCFAQCTGTADTPICANGGICTVASSGVVNLCFAICDPLVKDCPAGLECHPSDIAFHCYPDTSDEGKANDPCDMPGDCDDGLQCFDPQSVGVGCLPGSPDSPGCCTPFCPFPGGTCPNPDQQCIQWFDPAALPPNDPQLAIGFCGVPQ